MSSHEIPECITVLYPKEEVSHRDAHPKPPTHGQYAGLHACMQYAYDIQPHCPKSTGAGPVILHAGHQFMTAQPARAYRTVRCVRLLSAANQHTRTHGDPYIQAQSCRARDTWW